MNKRQKKKRQKKILLWEQMRNDAPRDKDIDFNGEGYRDPVAAAAIRSAMKNEKVR